jgi:hypothetical protein
MTVHHDTYAMQNARKHMGKLYICYKGAPTHPTQEIKQTPSSPRKWMKVAWSRGLVKISASWSCVGTWIKAISLSLHCLSGNDTSLLCVWFWNAKLGSLQHLWHLCYHVEVGHGYTPRQSHSWCMWSKGVETQQLATATYSASVLDWSTLDCLREDQNTKEEPKNWQVTEVDFLSNRHPTKSAYENPWRAK